MEGAVVGNCYTLWTMVQKAYTIGKYRYAAVNGNAAADKRFKASHDIGESTVRLFLKGATGSTQESRGGCSQT